MNFTPLDWKSARVHARLTAKDVARALGISVRMLIYFERGERNLRPEKKLKLLELILKGAVCQGLGKS